MEGSGTRNPGAGSGGAGPGPPGARPSRLRRVFSLFGTAHRAPHARLRKRELSVVACDLRGFTAFLESAGPEEGVAVLAEYYGAVGEVVARFGGKVKDHAGDGVLVLVAAARDSAHPAARAIAIAQAIRDRTTAAIAAHPTRRGLGVGAGVASGPVVVGEIEAAARLEAVAVGKAVNLAARLCQRAAAGQILVDGRTVELAALVRGRFTDPQEVAFKGFATPIEVFELRAL